MRPFISILLTELLACGLFVAPAPLQAQTPAPTTPIQHLVVIFGENISFDHYFGTYPNALNTNGEPQFTPAADTPTVNGLTNGLLTRNPNYVNATNGTGMTNPFRLDRSQAATADQNHNYGPEQAAFHGGLMDLFPKSVGVAGAPPTGSLGQTVVTTTGLNMGYYDGNTVTALWNYAQQFAMSDNSYSTTFGPSTPGALNLVSGQLNGVINNQNGTGANYWRRQWRVYGHRRRRPDRRRLFDDDRRSVQHVRNHHRRSFEHGRRQLGLLHPGIRSYRHECERHHRMRPQLRLRR